MFFITTATAFKIAKSYDQAVQAYVKASEALSKSDALVLNSLFVYVWYFNFFFYSIHLAGKALENAAFILAQNLNQPQRAAEAYQRASNYFMTQGMFQVNLKGGLTNEIFRKYR